ncbi:T9SS type A sorting domain-containing protein [Ferruginibacter sp.]
MQNRSLHNFISSFNNSLAKCLPPVAARFFALLLFIGVGALKSNAQVNTYSFTTSTGNVMETGGFSNLLGTNLDDNASAMTNIGFNFTYAGSTYTNFSVSSNGLMALGITATTEYDNSIPALTGTYLLPYWDDNYTDIDGNVQYKLMGVAGSRKLVVDYNLSALSFQGTADKHFQVWLFETSNKIMFVYGSGNNSNDGFSVGILKSGTSDFMSITTSTHTSSIVTANDNNGTWPGSGRAYIFNTSVTLPVSFLNFSGYNDGSRNLLQWSTVTESNNLGFEIQRSADGVNYSVLGFVSSLAPGGNSSRELRYNYADNNPSAARQYYRFRQVDMDNHSRLSSVIRIDAGKATQLKVESVYPNPANTMISLSITAPEKTKLTISFMDITGKKVLQKDINVEAGRNIIPVDISKLPNNTYVLKASTTTGDADAFKIDVVK